jgi:phosphate/phosphite/phosphonate ABC transporter binding protein
VSGPKVVFGLVIPSAAVAPRVDALAAWMSEHSGLAIERSDASSYEALAMAVREGKVDVAWLPPIVLVRLAEAVTALGSILRNGRTSYESALIVRADSKIKSVEKLRGHRAGWVDPWSAAGFVLPRVKMVERGMDPRASFRTETFYGSHRAAIEALRDGACDVVGTYARADDSGEITRGAWNEVEGADVRVLASMGAIPPDVIAVRRNMLPRIHEKLLEALRAACTDEKAKKTVKEIFGGDDLAEGLADGYDALRRALETAMARGLFD